jgi:MoaA/NifB/PqqE/SkfB family radical SAM enzyme
MDDGLYRKIIEELRRIGSLRSLLLMLQNEPLLDRKFPERVRLARETFGPGVRIASVTNGAPLTMAMIRALESSGIDCVDVSIDAVNEDTYGRIRRGLNFHRVVENTLSLIEHLGSSRVKVRFLRQQENEGEEDAFADYWRGHKVRVGFTEPTNRAGWLESYDSIRKQQPDSWKKLVYPVLNRLVPACPLPFASMCILWDGRVITCCHDWGPRDTVGDVSASALEQVWRGEKINHYRHLLWNHGAEESLVCAGCSLSDRFWRE